MTTINRLDPAISGALLLEPERLDEAVVGATTNADGETILVYDYNKLVRIFATDGLGANEEPDEIALADASEWVDYNTLRALPYMGSRAPIVVCEPLPAGLLEGCPPEDGEVIEINGKTWLKVST